MDKQRNSYLKLALIFILVITSCVTVATEKPFLPEKIVLATHDLPPYGSYHPDGSFKGIAYDRVACALNLMGIKLVLNVRPWNRAQFEVKRGIADGFFAGSKNEEREQYAVRSVEIADQKWQWYLLKESKWDVNSIEFKANARVSSFLGANMEKWLKDNNFNTMPPPPNTDGLAEMLIRERIDAALANNYVMDLILESIGETNNVQVHVLKSKPLYVYFGNDFIAKNSAFLSLFNSSIHLCM